MIDSSFSLSLRRRVARTGGAAEEAAAGRHLMGLNCGSGKGAVPFQVSNAEGTSEGESQGERGAQVAKSREWYKKGECGGGGGGENRSSD